MDADSDGVLSRDEAQAGLATLVIACPMSGCIFKASKANRGRIRRVIEQSQPQRVAYDLTAFREAYLNLPKDAYCLAEYFAPPSSAERCDTGSCVVNHHDVQHKRASPWGHLLAGAASGAVSRTITAPLETLRLHAMAGSGRSLPEARATSRFEWMWPSPRSHRGPSLGPASPCLPARPRRLPGACSQRAGGGASSEAT